VPIANLDVAQIQYDAVSTYEAYKYTEAYFPAIGGSLPNGVKDEFNASTGELTKRIGSIVVQASDITAYDTTQASHDVIYFGTLNPQIAQNIVGAGTVGIINNDRDSRFNTLSSYAGSEQYGHYTGTNLRLVVPKGTYANLAAAQTALTGMTLIYQLSTPVVAPITVAPVPLRKVGAVEDGFAKAADGLWYKTKRIGNKTLQASDVSSMITVHTNLDWAMIPKQTDSAGYNSTINGNGKFTIEGYPELLAVDATANIGTSSANIYNTFYTVGFPKGTTLAQAQAALTGKTLNYQLATPVTELVDMSNFPLKAYSNGTVIVEPYDTTLEATTLPTVKLSYPVTNNAQLTNFAGTAASGFVEERNAQIMVNGVPIRNELNYNPQTLAEWTKTGVTGDSTGLLFDVTQTTTTAQLTGLGLKINTKYGILYNIPLNTANQGMYGILGDITFASNAVSVGEIGNKKVTVTTGASISNNRLFFNKNNVGTGSIKIVNFRVFELPTGSQIEADFTNLTADQLAVKYPMPKNVTLPLLRFDGTDDYATLLNTKELDVTSAPLAVFATVRIAVDANTGHILSKNLDTAGSRQYSIAWQSTNSNMETVLSGNAFISPNNAVAKTIWCNIGFIWDGTVVKHYINYVQSGTPSAFAGTLTSQPNIRLGKREGGTYLKQDLATLSIYTGTKATEANILKAEAAISRQYLGL